MKITTETLSKEVVSLLVRGREVIDNQVQVDDDKVMTKIGDSWVLITAKASPRKGVVVKAVKTQAEREVDITAFLKANPTKKYTANELSDNIADLDKNQVSPIMTRMVQANNVQRQKRTNGSNNPSYWEYFL